MITFTIDFDSKNKETIFIFESKNEKLVRYEFRVDLSPEQIKYIISGLNEWRKELLNEKH